MHDGSRGDGGVDEGTQRLTASIGDQPHSNLPRDFTAHLHRDGHQCSTGGQVCQWILLGVDEVCGSTSGDDASSPSRWSRAAAVVVALRMTSIVGMILPQMANSLA